MNANPKDDKPAGEMRQAIKGQASQALVLQGYATALERQPAIDFGGETRLKDLQDKMNGALGRAKDNVKVYLTEIEPAAIGTITRVDRYFNLNSALIKLLRSNESRPTILRNLKAIEVQTEGFRTEANDVARRLDTLRGALNGDAAQFESFKKSLQVVTEADGGLIKELDNQMRDLDGKLAGAIAGAAVSGVAVAGGLFLVAVGAIPGFITAGTSTPLVLVGGVIVVGGIAGAVGSGIAIGALVGQKNELLRRQTGLKTELKFAQGLEGNFSTLAAGAANSADAAQQMANAWTGLSGHLLNLHKDIEAGRADEDLIELFIAAAEGDIQDVKGDVRIIKQQLTGARTQASTEAPLTEVIDKAMEIANDNGAIRATA